MKSILFISAILASLTCAQAFGEASVIVEFENGNQIFGSYVTIYSDGTVVHRERSCCPPHTDTVAAQNLSSAEVSHLLDLIHRATDGNMVDVNGSPTTEGSQSGQLVAYDKSALVTLMKVERSLAPEGVNHITVNGSAEAHQIKNFIEAYVQHPLIP